MNRNLLCCVASSLLLLVVFFPRSAKAQDQGHDVVLPAGTLLHCTLNEPNFSSKTAAVGDPVLCHLSNVFVFDRPVLPRGAYLGGHLEADKEPGHFVGKGYLDLQFDHLGLPDGQVALPTKVIAARGYKVDRQGDIVGNGHATRDVVEWMIPPLWPWKLVTLPARGPRPTLKGEEQLTMRLMEDVVIPGEALGWHYFGKSSSQNPTPQNGVTPTRYAPAQVFQTWKPASAGYTQVAEEQR
jgi:hypothetical protein